MTSPTTSNGTPGSPRSDFFAGVRGKPFTENQRFLPSAALRRFERELAYYRADEPYLPVEKRAERCWKLSALLTLAHQQR